MDNRENWATEISRSVQSVRDSQFVTKTGVITEKALEIFHIPRSVQDIDVITLADEYNCALEATVVLFLMATRDGEPRTGAKLYSSGIGLLFWDINWTASTKATIWHLHQALKVGCKDDLDFVIKLAYCFVRAEKRGLAELWAKYFQVNYRVIQDALDEARNILASHHRMNALEEERDIDINIVGRIRQVFISAWQNKVTEITDDKPVPCLQVEKTKIAAISSHCICNQPKGKKVIMATAVDGVAIVGGYPRQMPAASFIVCLTKETKEKKKENLFIDQIIPIGSSVSVIREKKKALIGKITRLPSTISFAYKQTLDIDLSKEERLSLAEFTEGFLCSEFEEENYKVEVNWVGDDMADEAIIVGWTEKSGQPIAILAPIKNSDVKSNFEVGNWFEATVRKVVRDPSGKGGFVLISLNYDPDVSIEINTISLSPAGYGLEVLEGKTIDLCIESFDENGNPLLTNINQITKDLKVLREEISKSSEATKKSEKNYIELSALTTEINEDEEKAVVIITRKEGIIHFFEINQTYVPGKDLGNLRIGEEIVIRLISKTNGDEILVEYFAKEEIRDMPKGWGLNEIGDKVIVPLCLEDKDLEGWNVRPELIDFVKRHSWQYCLTVRIISLKERMSRLNEGMIVRATVKGIDQDGRGEDIVRVVFGDNIPGSIPGRFLSSPKVSEGDELSLCVRGVDPETGLIRLVDEKKEKEFQKKRKETAVQQIEESIAKMRTFLRNDEDFLVRLKEQLGKIQYGIDHAKTRSYAAEREVWKA
ncbi:hypothetical protein KKH26_01420, partial [Patescibacteria group bacterium]|nr:hypothetical protein [Patescibacteria group bacterium]